MSPFSDRPQVPRLPGPVRPDKAAQAPTRSVPRYQVVLLHDAAVDLMVVVRSVMELTRFPRAEATHKMWQAHHCGRSVILVTYLERAELYAEQFAAKGLTVTLEPV
jgi:ATP-dependent Clp protease adapter protein ClpS